MVHRLYTTRKNINNPESEAILNELKSISGLENLSQIKIFNRYDIQGLSDEMLEQCRYSVFAEPLTDSLITEIPNDYDYILAVEYLPGQFDQRADAAEQCTMLLLGFRPLIKTAKIYLFYGEIKNHEALRKFFINPVESREAKLTEYDTLNIDYLYPDDVKILDDYSSLKNLAMSHEDLECCKKYFESEHKKPTLTEIKVIDTYWSDHCRHTTFLTHIDSVEIHEERVKNAFELYLSLRKKLNYPENKPVTLMDIATIGAKYINNPDVVNSEENNACTVRINVNDENWLLLFKNETHNHPTEIEPFGGAATCIGGAIRDPLSGRAYVYQAMRITGASNPYESPMPGKLPQRTIITKAAQGYSSYGNQIGIPTGLVDEIYHEGYKAKRLEVGAVIAAVPESNVIRETPSNGDIVLLLGGRTGRDGIGGATGSSVSHTASSLDTCGAEVQKGNAPEERKLQRLFRNPEFSRIIKKCNDFGAGGVSVAVGELADGLDINLDAVPLKYSGLDGTEIAVSESQERMAVVISPKNLDKLISISESEDVEATVIARVNDSGRMRMTWRGKEIVNLSREFINSNGASRHINILVNESKNHSHKNNQLFPEILGDLNVCSKRGLSERFDSTVGANTVLMPFGGKYQKTPAQIMAAKIPGVESNICSLMSYGFDPYISENSSFDGAYIAVSESLCKIIAGGGNIHKCWLTLQEYFGKPEHDPSRWGLPFGALLGALKAQIDFGVPAIGGKDSMSGSFMTQNGENLDVPPTLISFAVSISDVNKIISPEFKQINSRVIILSPDYDENGLPDKDSLLHIFSVINELNNKQQILSCSVPVNGGIKSMIMKMCLGNNLGFEFANDFIDDDRRCKFIIELVKDNNDNFPELGHTIAEPEIIINGTKFTLNECEKIYESPLNQIFPVDYEIPYEIPDVKPEINLQRINNYSQNANKSPKFLIPVFPGTNCEYETAKSIERSGGNAEIYVVKTLTPELMKRSAHEFAMKLRDSQALMLPGGFSNGDEPDGSGKFIAIFLRSQIVKESVEHLLNHGGLICGICNGFQALVKTGLLPYGKICEPEKLSATLTFNAIGRHQSRIIRTKIITNNSVWLKKYNAGEIVSMPISHGEGRFICDEKLYCELMRNGQIAGQYVDVEGNISMMTCDNPSGSNYAVECVTSPDGRILGRMGHSERVNENLYRNVAGNYDLRFFESACEYFMKV